MSRSTFFRTVVSNNLNLSDSDIHVWSSWLDLPSFCISQLERMLSTDEVRRAGRFRFEKDRKKYIIARGALRLILGLYLDVRPEQIRFAYGEHGKPKLHPEMRVEEIHFNLSHSNNLALLAIASGREIGIDVEYCRPLSDMNQIAKRFFSTSENSEFCTVPDDQRLNAFYNCWTRKEAFVKAIGDGLTIPLDSFEVSLTPNKPAKLLSIEGDQSKANKWTVADCKPLKDYIAALAAKGNGFKITSFDFYNSFLANIEKIKEIKRYLV